ncbi:MAG: 4-hydroxy-tetrahydrodipicolinate reductase [Verrucomicrobiota bacterium]
MTRIAIIGARGRMGVTLCRLAQEDADLELAGTADQGDDLAAAVESADAVIEFAHHSATVPTLESALELKKPLVIGTTGHTPDELAAIRQASEKLPVVFAPNYSVGVNTLFWLTRKAAQILGPSFDREVVEMHHKMKVDAPSGTAKRLGEILAEAQGSDYEEVIRHGRSGETGARTAEEIGMHALRGGDVVGDHTVYYAGTGERVELTHRATSRETFAAGALRAAVWIIPQPTGLYSMQDVLGLGD